MGTKHDWNGWGQGLLAATVGLCFSMLTSYPEPVRAQVPVNPNPVTSPASLRTLYVNSSVGNDSGSGNADAPLRTITAALQHAAAGTVIQLSPGTYSADTGEVFPLNLPSGVVLRGDERNYGVGYDIVGGGDFISPTMARQSITILPKDGAEIRGVSVRNQGRRGYAVWTESTSPIIEHNTFTRSVHDGVFLAGASSATVSDNRFYRNGANGISVLGTSTPTIVGNLIQETGYGIAIGQNSRPVVTQNRISRNRSGLVITGRSQPLLRHNVITENLEDGIVAIAESLPDLGTSAEAGGNQFEANGNYNIHNATQGNIIQAHGNQLGDTGKIQGEVAYNAANTEGMDIAAVPGLFGEQEITDSASPSSVAPATSNSGSAESSAIRPNTANVEPTAVGNSDRFRPVPFVSESSSSESSFSDDRQPTAEPTIEESNPTGPAGGISSIPSAQTSASPEPVTASNNPPNGPLPANGAPIPIANTTDIVSAARRYPARYRVLITPKSGDTIEAVRAVAPTATPAQLAGQEVYLVGHYSTRTEAQNVLRQLTQEGYLATAEAIEREVDS